MIGMMITSVMTVKDVRSLYPMRGISDATIDYYM